MEKVEKPDQLEVISDPTAIDDGLSGKAKEAAQEASRAESEGIFAGCGSFKKL